MTWTKQLKKMCYNGLSQRYRGSLPVINGVITPISRVITPVTVSNLSRIDFYKIDHLVGAKLFWGSYRL